MKDLLILEQTVNCMFVLALGNNSQEYVCYAGVAYSLPPVYLCCHGNPTLWSIFTTLNI